MTNCTVTENLVTGGLPNSPNTTSGRAFGGGLSVRTGLVHIIHGTIASNRVSASNYFTATNEFAVGANLAVTNATLSLQSSLLAAPSNNVYGTLTDAGYNMSSDGSAAFSSGSSFNFTDPKLLPLADNGGPTLTMALAPNSPAIDWVPAGNAPANDQRGVPRPIGSDADVGAFEYGATLPLLAVQRNGGAVNMSFNGSAGFTYHLKRSTNFAVWETQEIIGPLPSSVPVLRSIPATQPYQFFKLSFGP